MGEDSIKMKLEVCMRSYADPVRKAMVQVQAVFSEMEKARLLTKLRQARDAP